MTKKVYNKQKFFSVITKNSNGEILTKNLLLLKDKMGWKGMKKFNFGGIHWKIWLLGGVQKKPI